MTIRNLEYFFAPRSLALIGASERPGSVGSVLTGNVLRAGFRGAIYPVNLRRASVHGLKAYATVESLPATPELAVIATPAATVPGLIAALGARGTKAAIVLSAGFGEGGQAGGSGLKGAMLAAAGPHLLRIIGPNCLGIQMPLAQLDASFAGTRPVPGRIAFVTQSGAVATAVVDWATTRGIGFSHVLTLGDMADVDLGDSLDMLARNAEARAILLYIEAVTSPRKFMSAARAAARAKQVSVVKAGRFAEGARAAASHTGALAGSDAVYQSVLRRAGMLRVLDLEELFEAVATLSKIGPLSGDRLAILTNGGGAGVLATDTLVSLGGALAELAPATLTALDRVLPATWSHGNPIDIVGDAGPERYRAALEATLADDGSDAVLVLNCPTAITPGAAAARAVLAGRGGSPKPVLAGWLGGASAAEGRKLLEQGGVPCHDTPSAGVRAFMHLVGYRRVQEALAQTPPSLPREFRCDAAAVRRAIAAVLADGRQWLDAQESKAVLAAYGIAAVVARIARTPEEAGAIADAINAPVALKIHSPDITHKSDVGGVVLGLEGRAATRAAAEEMGRRVGQLRPEARIAGYAVEQMVRRPRAHELIIGVNEDAQFGPVILFGQGGVAVEVVADTTLELPPLDLKFARDMIARTRVYRLLKGYRDRPPADLEAIALTLLKVSQLVIDHAEIRELDINPLLADETGVIALDARVRVGASHDHPHRRLAIKPYPSELETRLTGHGGRAFLVRPIRGEDEPQLVAAFARLGPDEIRLRFHAPVKSLGHVMASRFSQINYDREMALILTEPGPPGTTPIYGVARLAADPNNETAEYAIIVGAELAGQGLGRALMDRLIAHARERGLKELVGHVLQENARMLNLCRDLGFELVRENGDGDTVLTRLAL